MSDWSDSKHPRGQKGRFVDKDQAEQVAPFPTGDPLAGVPYRDRRVFKGTEKVEEMQPGDIFEKVDYSRAGGFRNVIVGRVDIREDKHFGRVYSIYDHKGQFVASGRVGGLA